MVGHDLQMFRAGRVHPILAVPSCPPRPKDYLVGGGWNNVRESVEKRLFVLFERLGMQGCWNYKGLRDVAVSVDALFGDIVRVCWETWESWEKWRVERSVELREFESWENWRVEEIGELRELESWENRRVARIEELRELESWERIGELRHLESWRTFESLENWRVENIGELKDLERIGLARLRELESW